MSKSICDTCGKPIRDGQAAIVENTPSRSRHWHHGCCPWLAKPLNMPADSTEKQTTDDSSAIPENNGLGG